jgi:hypothetical protein
VAQVRKPACESRFGYGRSGTESAGGVSQPRAQKVLVRRLSNELLENTGEVKSAHSDAASHARKRVFAVYFRTHQFAGRFHPFAMP